MMPADRDYSSSLVLPVRLDFTPPVLKQFINKTDTFWHELSHDCLCSSHCDRSRQQALNVAGTTMLPSARTRILTCSLSEGAICGSILTATA